ncbi:MAG: ABC transporter ATP-binding protein [Spirochaetota bacterium]|nr:MAG: ABC transporter ATP-binding protein [Spirochaetota bacterium]
MEKESSALVIQNICKTFGEVTAVKDFGLEVKDGEFVSLLGPSGCGKTTLLRIIAGFEIPDSGEVLLDGENIIGLQPFKRPMNMVFQRYALFPHMTVYENIAFSQFLKKRPKEEIEQKVKKMLELVQLEGFEPRKPNQLSGGQCQRIALARALINEPRVLLLDEPLGALDLKIRKQMQIELKKIQEKLKITFIYVTHDQEEALVMSDRIVLMKLGEIIQVDTPKRIYNHPNSRFAATFIGESNIFDGEVVKVKADHLVVGVDGLQLLAHRNIDAKVGDKIVLAIRLEKVSRVTGASKKEYDNQFPGKIEDVVFFGALVKYYVRISENITLIAEENITEEESDQDAEENNIGTTVTLGFSRKDVNVLIE